MNVFLWIVAGVLAAAFLLSGSLKLARSKDELREQGMGWVDDVDGRVIKLVGTAEVLAAVGLVVPPLVGVAPVLAPLAALGLVLVMVGAVVVHSRRREAPMVAVNLALLVLAAVVVVGRLGPEQFSA